ncbi:hypothetical protein NQ314_021444 [Rhamnusium bicolor]|uniref:Uncharacterized protein n=1 Tax=Rhamnusium bicolor TaxID=1586634 RepID=A0AAV8WIA1_9CUCU|nr:hypothetical protein NQ314_021444 [Rhamnusium bicolor]
MSVSDPLIKDIKGCVQQFFNVINNNGKIYDNYFYFILLGRTLEKVFNKGLIAQQNTLYFTRIIDPYAWMVSIIKAKSGIVTFTYKNCVDIVKERCDIVNNGARFRLLVKYCLAKKCLHVPVEFLMRTRRVHLFYGSNSIIGDEILAEIFLSVLFQISKIDFSLDLNNSSFLDCTWYIPDLVHIELVPCKKLGLSVSVAAEHGSIKIGDVLDKLNGLHITSSSKGHLNGILRSRKSKPINLTIAKAYNHETKEFFMPIKSLLKHLNLNCEIVIKQYEELKDEIIVHKKTCYGYDVKYLGFVDVGSVGNVKQVEKAMRNVLQTKVKENIFSANGMTINRINKNVVFEIGEIGVKIKDVESNEVILDHSYMKISACGSIPTYPKNVGYCAR